MEMPYRQDALTGIPLEHYMKLLSEASPQDISERTGLPNENGRFTLDILGEKKTITLPDFADEGWGDRWKILFGRYLLEGRKIRPMQEFITYSQLPWGEVYNEKFKQRCILRLAGTFGSRIETFKEKCEKNHAVLIESTGCGYEFSLLDELRVRFILWEGDEDFPASAQILFSDNFPDSFTAEDSVVVCEYILGNMK